MRKKTFVSVDKVSTLMETSVLLVERTAINAIKTLVSTASNHLLQKVTTVNCVKPEPSLITISALLAKVTALAVTTV